MVKSVKVELPVEQADNAFSQISLVFGAFTARSSACYCREELTDSGFFFLGPIIIPTFSSNVDVTSRLF